MLPDFCFSLEWQFCHKRLVCTDVNFMHTRLTTESFNSSVLCRFVTSPKHCPETFLHSSFNFMEKYLLKKTLTESTFKLETLLPLHYIRMNTVLCIFAGLLQFSWMTITLRQLSVVFLTDSFSFMPFLPYVNISTLQEAFKKKGFETDDICPLNKKNIDLFLIGLCLTTQTAVLKTYWVDFDIQRSRNTVIKNPEMQLCWHYKISTPSEKLQISQRQEKRNLSRSAHISQRSFL